MQSVIEGRHTTGEDLYYQALGDNIRAQREKHGLRQLDLALEMGYESSVVVSYWETGRSRPSAYMVARMEEFFGEQVRP